MPRRTPPQTVEGVVADLAEEVRGLRRNMHGVADDAPPELVIIGGAGISATTVGGDIHQQSVVLEGLAAGFALSASDNLYATGTVVLSGSNNVTVKTNGQTIIIDVTGGTAAGSGAFIAVNGGAASAGTVVLSNSNGVTFGGNASTVTASFSQSTHSHSTGPGAISGSNTAYSSGTVVLTGAGIVTVASTTGQAFIISATASTHSHATGPGAIIASDATYTSGTVLFTGSGAATVQSDTGQHVVINVPTQSVQTQGSMRIQVNGAATSSGVIVLSDSNGVGFGGNANTITASYSQSTHAHSAFVLSDSNGLVWGTNASTVTGSYTQSTHSHSTGPSAIIASNGTFTSGTVLFTGSGAATVATSGTGTQQTVVINAPAQTVQTQNAVALAVNGGAASTGTIVLSDSNGIGWGGNASTVTASYSQSTHSHSTAPSAIIASNATFTSGSVVFTGSNIVTVKTSGTGTQQTIVVDATAGGGGVAVAASNTTYTSGTVVITGVVGNIVIGSNAGQQAVVSEPYPTRLKWARLVGA